MRRCAAEGSLRRFCAAAAVAAALTAALSGAGTGVALAAPATRAEPSLYLVTLEGSCGLVVPRRADQRRLPRGPASQAGPGSGRRGRPGSQYRWTSALDGFAVAADPEPGQRHHGRPRRRIGGAKRRSPARRGALSLGGEPQSRTVATRWGRCRDRRGRLRYRPGEPRLRDGAGSGRGACAGFTGVCEAGEDWPDGACTSKLVGARWFVAGFGAANVRSTSSLSPGDDSGHGTLVASVAAGNSGVSVKVGAQPLGAYSGTAPQARLAVYKACWTAPDPDHDGCATADLVTAIDRATADGVDVLNLSVAGGSLFDTVDRALLGAAQSGVFVTAAAGNDGRFGYAAHPAPWVTTVGAVTGPMRGGTISMAGKVDGSLSGAMSSRRTVTARLVPGASIAAPGSSPRDARICRAGSLDAGRAAGRIVICERGGIGRVDKSRTVALAGRSRDGAGQQPRLRHPRRLPLGPLATPRRRRRAHPAGLAAFASRCRRSRCGRAGRGRHRAAWCDGRRPATHAATWSSRT